MKQREWKIEFISVLYTFKAFPAIRAHQVIYVNGENTPFKTRLTAYYIYLLHLTIATAIHLFFIGIIYQEFDAIE